MSDWHVYIVLAFAISVFMFFLNMLMGVVLRAPKSGAEIARLIIFSLIFTIIGDFATVVVLMSNL